MNYTFNNHLYYTIGGRKFGYRQTPHEKYEVIMGNIDYNHYKKSSWRDELRRTADCVLNEFGKDLVVFFSGGTDSEIVIRNFLEIGHKPRCVFLKFKDEYNAPDAKEAEESARDLGIDLEMIDFDVKEFYNSGEALWFSNQIDCSQITYLMIYYQVMKLAAPAVMGGEMLLQRDSSLTSPSYWYHCFRENEDASAMRFSEKFKIPLVNEWFSYTPEMMLYYLEDFELQEVISDPSNKKLSSVSSKNTILKSLFPEIRTKKKTHGFEKLLGFNFESYRELSLDKIPRLEPSLDGIPVYKIMEQLA
jgi:hypothetical protein